MSVAKAALMGILGWLQQGWLIKILLGGNDNTSEKLMRSLFAERFLRIECECEDIKLDDYMANVQVRLDAAAKQVWADHSESILLFVKPL